ncbi:MAG: GlxA family transcriptional regulator [Alphaproteobacteria bacterium]
MFAGPPDHLPQSLAFLLLPQFSLMAFASAVEPLRAANRLACRPLYSWEVLGPDARPVVASNGVAIPPDRAITDVTRHPCIVVCGGYGMQAFDDPRTLAALRRLARTGTIMGAISTASYVLARAGLLAGRRCTIHWENLDSFRQDWPDLNVTDDLYEIDGPVFTCSGGTAAMDLMLHLIVAQHGHGLAAAVSDQFIHQAIRESRQRQRMATGRRLGTGNPTLMAIVDLMEQNIEAPLGRHDIAERAGLSERQVERLFARELAVSPRRYYFQLRLERADALLRQTAMPILDVALATGFVSASHFAKSYRSHFGRTPRQRRAEARLNLPAPPHIRPHEGSDPRIDRADESV